MRKIDCYQNDKGAADREDDQQLRGFSHFTTYKPDTQSQEIKCISQWR